MMEDINSYKLKSGPATIYYIPNFVSEIEEKGLIDAVNSAPKPRWTQLSNRRLQNWGGVPHPKGMIAEDIPPWLKIYTERIGKLNLFNGKIPNHVLVNEYLAGQGIMPHLDGPLFFPTISTISLGSHTVLNFYHPMETTDSKNEKPNDDNVKVSETDAWKDRLAYSLLLEPRSLLILKDEVYEHFLHGIENISQDTLSQKILNLENCDGKVSGQVLERSTRVSLTIRYVPKTTKPMIRLGRR